MTTTNRSGSGMLPKLTRNHLRLFVALLGISACLWGYREYLTPEKRAVRQRLSEADTKSEAAINDRMKPLQNLFAKGRKGAKEFAKESLSWGGKWALVKGFVVGDSHREFLAEAFGRHVFTPTELKDAIEGACKAFADDLDGVESEMLVKLRADLADPDRPELSVSPHLRNNESFTQEYRRLAARVATQTGSDLAVGAGREILVLVGTEVATRAAMQAARAAAAEMGVQGTVLGIGASSTLATLGVGLVVGIIIDYVVDQIFKLAGYDPESKIAATVIESIDKMEAALTRDVGLERFLGYDKKGSLRVEMEKLHEARSKLRRETVELMLTGGDGK